jgi:aldehyde dehydrogenase (NAD+)
VDIENMVGAPVSNFPNPVDTPLEEIDQIYADLQQSYRKRVLLPLETRKRALAQVAHMIQDNKDRICDAIHQDLRRPHRDTTLFEVSQLVKMCLRSIQNLEEWSQDFKPDTAGQYYESWNPRAMRVAKGPVLIIGPYNFPFHLTINVLTGAIAAGCPAVVKFSEVVPASAALIQDIFPKYLDPQVFKLVNGGVPQTTALLEKKWGHIFYTGNGVVGRIIATAAAKTLTPVTLELGGKSPTIIDPSFDIKLAARRILWGKIQTSGQVCVAPDYILTTKECEPKLIEAFKEALEEFYPQGAQASNAYGRMANNRHFKRAETSLLNSKGTIAVGGKRDEQDNFVEPTLVTDVPNDDSLMQDEIFAPVLPVITVKDMDEAIEYINDRETPLALYLFTTNPELKQKVTDYTLSGNMIINDVLQQLVAPELPMGGVGESGYGTSAGRFIYDGFTHLRAIVDVPLEAEPFFGFRYPPYTAEQEEILKPAMAPLKIPYPNERNVGINV